MLSKNLDFYICKITFSAMKKIICGCLSLSFLLASEGEVFASVNLTNGKIEKQSIAKKNVTHIVQPGETIYRISVNYHVSQKSLIEKNGIKDNNIFVGQKLILPEGAYLDDEKNNNVSIKNSVVDTTKINNQGSINASSNRLDATTFIWPARGSVITRFGHITNSGKLEGVNIGTEKGAIVRSSSSGEIVFTDKVEGYDNVILIKHYNGFMTAYGHIDPLVSVGDKVKKGQVIAYVANNNQSQRSMLYFSVRKNGKSYDPEKIIPTKIND